MGFPVSAKTLHQRAFDSGLTKMTFEEEMAQAKTEEAGPFAKVLATAGADANPDNNPDNNKGPKDKQKEKTKQPTK